MNLSLCPRLRECCRYIVPGQRIADIGCDHGYLSIHLLKNQIARSVIAADINEGPLRSALSNAARYGVSDRISFYLSDGLKAVPRDFDAMVCAGMGAKTMISILEAAPWLKSPQYTLILQCQTKTYLLRKFLSEQGYFIRQESITRDGRFLYTVMEVIWEPGHTVSPEDTYLSPALVRSGSPELKEYYGRILEGLRQAVEGKGRQAVPYMASAYDALTANPVFDPLKEDPYDNR